MEEHDNIFKPNNQSLKTHKLPNGEEIQLYSFEHLDLIDLLLLRRVLLNGVKRGPIRDAQVVNCKIIVENGCVNKKYYNQQILQIGA